MHFLLTASRGHLLSLQRGCPVLGCNKAKEEKIQRLATCGHWNHKRRACPRLLSSPCSAFFLSLSREVRDVPATRCKPCRLAVLGSLGGVSDCPLWVCTPRCGITRLCFGVCDSMGGRRMCGLTWHHGRWQQRSPCKMQNLGKH